MSKLKFILFLLLPTLLYSGTTDWGGTGLLRVPNGRVINDGDVRFTFSDCYPYRNYSVTFGFFPFLEVNGRIMELRDKKFTGGGWSGYGYYKDKIADFKVQLFEENAFLPSISVGVNDFHGTQLFFTEYIAASKQIGDFDFTLGYGDDFFGTIFNKNNKKKRELDGLFGGVEWKARDNISLIFEYDPTEKLALGRGTISSPYNYGVRWYPKDWLSCGYSYQRGDKHSVFVALTYPFGSTIVPQRDDPPFYGPVDWAPLPEQLVAQTLPQKLLSIQNMLSDEDLKNVQVALSSDMKTFYIEIENRKYLFHTKAIGRALRVASVMMPSDIETLCIVLKQIDVPMVEVAVSRADYIDYLNQKISEKELSQKIKVSNKISEKSVWWNEEYVNMIDKHNPIYYHFEPIKLESYWNDPSGFFKYRVGPALSLAKDINNGLSVVSSLKMPLYSNVSTRNKPSSNKPVRSDISKYLDSTGLSVDNLYVNQFLKVSENNYFRLTAGYLELQYAGIGVEYLRTFLQGRVALGNEITWANKREPDSLFGLGDDSATTKFINLYSYFPKLETTVSAKVGKFLGGDKGVRLDISRDVRGGKVFMWYSKTDTKGFTGPNRNYSDKGVGFALPVRALWSSDSRGYYSTSIAPWSRDTGQPVKQLSLYNFIREYTPIYIRNYLNQLAE
ncbi:YjbH domain-containing protein [bacterium]|nr:YjbH domain-containing protein [bacterium]